MKSPFGCRLSQAAQLLVMGNFGIIISHLEGVRNTPDAASAGLCIVHKYKDRSGKIRWRYQFSLPGSTRKNRNAFSDRVFLYAAMQLRRKPRAESTSTGSWN
jgi:hypothetical protein